MSIILDALRKIQDQKAACLEPADAGTGEDPTSVPDTEQIPTPQVTAEAEKPQAVANERGSTTRRRAVKAQSGSQRFAGAPKILLGIILVVGVFTTGWFVSTIYFNLKSTPAPVETDTEMALARTHAAENPANLVNSPEAPPAEVAPELAQPAAAAPTPLPEPPVAEVVQVEEAVQGREVVAKVVPIAVSEAVPIVPIEDERHIPSPEEQAPVSIPERGTTSTIAEPVKETRPAPPKMSPESELQVQPGEKGRPELKINAIAWKSKDPKAIVNMQRVYEGDVIEGAKVLVIQRHGIIFEYEGEPFEVRF